jgi:hypothetical protein
LRREVGDKRKAAAYSRTLIALQFTAAATCIAKNAWTARLRTSVLMPKRKWARLF